MTGEISNDPASVVTGLYCVAVKRTWQPTLACVHRAAQSPSIKSTKSESGLLFPLNRAFCMFCNALRLSGGQALGALIREWAERRLSSLGGKIIEFRTPKTSLRPRRSSQWHAEKGQAAIVSFVYESGTLDIRVPLSPVPHLLTSNLTPSDSETQLVKRTIQQAEHEISRVVALSRSHSLRRLSNFMTAVNDALSRLEDVISKHRAVLSPIRRLPYEIIEHILLFSPDRDMDFQFERWKWTHICRRWRVVAIGAPELWANLRTIVACPNSRKGLDKIEMQIARAKHLPIHFHFSAYLKDLPSTHPVIQLLVRHSERWGNVYFSTTSTTLNSFSKVRGRLPQLRTLGLAIWRCQDQDRIDLFSFAPQLTSVTILGTYEHPIPLPPTSLSYLSHRYTTSATLNTFFSQADTLQSLELLWTVNTFNDYPVTFPRLASLKVSYGGAGSGGFLNNITTPALHTLMIDGRAYSADVLSSVHDLIRRSMITSILKTIGFYGRSLQSLDITPLLQTLPNIETFKGMLPSKQDLASFVAFSSSDMRFLPRLQSLLFIPFFDQLDSEMITLINAVAYSRSTAGLAFRTAEARVLPLKDFCVTVTGTGPFDECTKAMARLEGWDHTEESVYMASLRDSLSEALPVAKRRTNEVRHFRDSLKLRSAQAIDKLMTSIEKCSVTRAEDLLISALPSLMARMMTQPPDIWFSDRYYLPQRAATLLERWGPLMKDAVPRRRWFQRGSSSLVYIPSDSDVRLMAGHRKMIYGFPELGKSPDVFWDKAD